MKNEGEEGKMGVVCFLFEIQGTFLLKRSRSRLYRCFKQMEIGYFILNLSLLNVMLLMIQ